VDPVVLDLDRVDRVVHDLVVVPAVLCPAVVPVVHDPLVDRVVHGLAVLRVVHGLAVLLARVDLFLVHHEPVHPVVDHGHHHGPEAHGAGLFRVRHVVEGHGLAPFLGHHGPVAEERRTKMQGQWTWCQGFKRRHQQQVRKATYTPAASGRTSAGWTSATWRTTSRWLRWHEYGGTKKNKELMSDEDMCFKMTGQVQEENNLHPFLWQDLCRVDLGLVVDHDPVAAVRWNEGNTRTRVRRGHVFQNDRAALPTILVHQPVQEENNLHPFLWEDLCRVDLGLVVDHDPVAAVR